MRDVIQFAIALILALVFGSFIVMRYSTEIDIALDWWMDFCQKGRRQ